MSRDNAVLIVRLQVKRRYIWVVVHVQAHEMFGDPQWTRWWLWAHSIRYTTRRSLAQSIARKMGRDIDYIEHGIIQFFSAAFLDDCLLKNGEIDFPKAVESPTTWDDRSDEDDWKIISS